MKISRILTLMLAFAGASAAVAADKTGPSDKKIQAVVNKAIDFLKKQQNKDGSFAPRIAGPGVSALVAAGLLRNGMSPDDPLVKKTLSYIADSAKKDGGIYDKGLATYTTSVAVMALQEGNKNGRYDQIIKRAIKFIKGIQAGGSSKDAKFGGFSYGGDGRPDLSNTAFAVDAMIAAGMSKDDPAIKNALKFISRCQNLPSEHNDQAFAKKASKEDKGGFTYTPVNPEKNRSKTPSGGLRSQGAMTYSGLKSFLYAGVKKDDKRVQAAVDWIRRHYTLKSNPGAGTAGLYYYFHTFGKAMNALGEDTFIDADKKKHDWRKELFQTLKDRQQEDGSWRNSNRAFGESTPELATAFALLTLSYLRDSEK